jgi:mycofactocin system glycosyltransferase
MARDLLAGVPVTDEAAAKLARRLLAGGLAHPAPVVRPTDVAAVCDVVVPTLGAQHLDGSLSALSDMQVCIVDDASPDADSVASCAADHSATVIRLDVNSGPAAARNTGLRETRSSYVALVDSDARVDSESLAALVAHFDDPDVAAVAPRIRPTTSARMRSPLDLGPRAANVRPGARVGYVPSTVLVVRREAVESIGGFDETLRFGEDVDLVWRLTSAGWSVRYQPDVVAHHVEPAPQVDRLRRRMNYGTSAAGLVTRHRELGETLRPPLLPAATIALLAGRRNRAALTIAIAAVGVQWRGWRRTRLPARVTLPAATRDVAGGLSATSRWSAQIWWPVLLPMLMRRRATAIAAVLGMPAIAEEMAYGVGVWIGCARERTLRPVLPRFTGLTPVRNVAPGLSEHARTPSRQPE